MKAQVYKDRGGKWRWRIVASNGRKVAVSGENFNKKSNAERSLTVFIASVSLENYRGNL